MGKYLFLPIAMLFLAFWYCPLTACRAIHVRRQSDVNEWNDKTAEITGYTKEEAFDCSLVEAFIVPSMRDSVQDVLDNALEGRGTSNYELEFRTKSNEIRHLLVNATTRRDGENNVVGVVGVAQDVTEAVQRDRAVAGMALELRQLIDTANAPIFGIDIDGNVNEWNRRTSEITGYTKEEAFDEPLVETFIAPSMQDKVQEILDSALAGNETSNYELEFVSRDGEPRFLLVNATTRRDPENIVVGGKSNMMLHDLLQSNKIAKSTLPIISQSLVLRKMLRKIENMPRPFGRCSIFALLKKLRLKRNET